MKVWLYLPLFVILQVTLLGPGYADEVESAFGLCMQVRATERRCMCPPYQY